MKFQFLICVLILIQRSSSLDFTVKTSSELTKALGSVNAGDNIFLEDGIYIGTNHLIFILIILYIINIDCFRQI